MRQRSSRTSSPRCSIRSSSLIALGIAFFVLLTFVIPKFAAIFAKAGLTLPLPTKIAMLLYQVLANYWYHPDRGRSVG